MKHRYKRKAPNRDFTDIRECIHCRMLAVRKNGKMIYIPKGGGAVNKAPECKKMQS
jgi:hypothetical protein